MDFVKWAFVTFLILFGVVFLISVVIVKGNTVGKFSKTFCLVFGALMTGAGLYLSW